MKVDKAAEQRRVIRGTVGPRVRCTTMSGFSGALAACAGLACLAAGCAKGAARTAAPLSPEQASARLAELLGSPLPQDASEVLAIRMQGQADVLAVRFTCTSQGLGEFLNRSPHLPKKLTGDCPVLGHADGDPDWWRPELLQNPGGGTASWQHGSQKLSCDVLAGRSPPNWLWTVYLRVVIAPAGAAADRTARPN